VRGRTDLIASAAYQPEPAAAAAARRFIRQTLQSWDIAERSREADRLVDDAVLLTSELVTNAVVHAGTALDVTCRIASSELEIAVRDRHPSRTLPDIPEAASMSAERGRGLLLPTALASSWGVTYARTAKAVWFRMSLTGREDADDQATPPEGADLISAEFEADFAAADLGRPEATPSPSSAPSPTGAPSHAATPSPAGASSPGATPSPSEATHSSGPAHPSGPTHPSGPAHPSGPTHPSGPAHPFDPAHPSDPADTPSHVGTPILAGHNGHSDPDGPSSPAGRGGADAGFVASSESEVTVIRPGAALSPVPSRPPARASNLDDPAAALRPDLGTLSYDELLRHTVETARDVVTADAAYALVADEDGELRVRAAAGVGVSESLFAPSVPAVFADGAAAKSLVTVPFLVDGRVTGVLGAAATSADRFDGNDAAKLQRVADRVAMSLERARLSELERKRRGRIGFLAEASELLASTLDQEKTISLIAQLVVPRLAAWCAVLLADEAGVLQPEPVYVWHADESLIDPLHGLLAAVGPPEADEAGRSWSLAMNAGPDLTDEAVELASDAAWCFPLAARGRSLGVVVIGRPRGDRPPREALELAEDLARRAALALDNARLYEQQQLTSQALQRSLLPPELPQIPSIDLSVAHQVAGEGNEVGGDFYDVFPAGPDRWRFAIGDVCGTGPEAAAVTGLARHALRILAREGHDVADVVGRLNELILEESARGRFLTLLHGEITVLGQADQDREGTLFAGGGEEGERPSVRLRLVSAGHPLPLLLRKTDPDGIPQPVAEPQPLLGVIGDLTYTAQTASLFPGDVLLSVTDGITERKDASGRLLDDDDGLAALLAHCRGLNAGAVAARIVRAAEDFGAGPSTDDMAILVLRGI
jgi:serine phosphatase RsbU (regulator of sigma subunit)/anti-sigma regulatory factor (Ser/Thr protein kinase)